MDGVRMLSNDEEIRLRRFSYVPEHSVPLMTAVSGAEPHLIDEYLCFTLKDWIVVVGYPVGNEFNATDFEATLDDMIHRFRSKRVSLIAPELPVSIARRCLERESDRYYTLDLSSEKVPARPQRSAEKAAKRLNIECAHVMTEHHHRLSVAFVDRVQPPERVRKLLFAMPDFVRSGEDACVLNAWNEQGLLTAFYVVDLWPADFATYVIGCHSKENYAKGASDALFLEMIRISEQMGKRFMHLGLGVNKGVSRFKRKWGGIASLDYGMCELILNKPLWLQGIMDYTRKP